MNHDNPYYSLPEAAARLGVSYDRLWYALATGKVPPPARVGRTRLLTPDDIERLREHFGQASTPAPAGVTGPTTPPGETG